MLNCPCVELMVCKAISNLGTLNKFTIFHRLTDLESSCQRQVGNSVITGAAIAYPLFGQPVLSWLPRVQLSPPIAFWVLRSCTPQSRKLCEGSVFGPLSSWRKCA